MFRNGLEPWHIIVIAIVVMVLFGGKKMPEAARGLGRSLRILKSELETLKDEATSSTDSSHDASVTTLATRSDTDVTPLSAPATDGEPADHPRTRVGERRTDR